MTAVLVHYRSGGMLLGAVKDLYRQVGVEVVVHAVECGDDGTMSALEDAYPSVRVHRPGANVGYCGGNNLALKALGEEDRILIVNPDVRLPDVTTVQRLCAELDREPELGAVAPLIRTHHGAVEYLESVVDFAAADAYHDRTHLPDVPSGEADLRTLPWVNGACWLLRGRAQKQVGNFDERYFLFYEEVDWALRAASHGWKLGLLSTTEVTHTRSASFGGSTKGAYYYWRNRWLFCSVHANGAAWRRVWLRSWLRFMLEPEHLLSGAAANAFLGGVHACSGRFGPRPVRA